MKKNGILFRAASGILAAALTLSLSACGGSSSNSDASAAADSADSGATHLRLIYSPSLCAAPMYIAIENGYFEDEGLDIEQVTVDAAHVSEAIGADQVDVAAVEVHHFSASLRLAAASMVARLSMAKLLEW